MQIGMNEQVRASTWKSLNSSLIMFPLTDPNLKCYFNVVVISFVPKAILLNNFKFLFPHNC